MANWFRYGEWLPIASLAKDYDGPIVLTDETQTVQWHPEDGSRGEVDHKGPGESKSRKIKPAFWAPVRMVD